MGRLTAKYYAGTTLAVVGLAIAFAAFRIQMRPHTEIEDSVSWAMWAVGMALFGGGAILPFEDWPVAVVAAIATPFLAFYALAIAYWPLAILWDAFCNPLAAG